MNFTYYGHSCFSIEVKGTKLLFDPFITPNELANKVINVDTVQADYILISHGHADHIADCVRIASRTGAKVICLGLGLVGGYLLGLSLGQMWVGVSLGGLVGYCLPRFWLKIKIKQNQKALTLALPDALDLMVVCVEAGLTVDAAMQRVGQELGIAHQASQSRPDSGGRAAAPQGGGGAPTGRP